MRILPETAGERERERISEIVFFLLLISFTFVSRSTMAMASTAAAAAVSLIFIYSKLGANVPFNVYGTCRIEFELSKRPSFLFFFFSFIPSSFSLFFYPLLLSFLSPFQKLCCYLSLSNSSESLFFFFLYSHDYCHYYYYYLTSRCDEFLNLFNPFCLLSLGAVSLSIGLRKEENGKKRKERRADKMS